MRKLGDWFDRRSENNANSATSVLDENMKKNKFVEVNEVEILPNLSPKIDENINLPERHLHVDILNMKPSMISSEMSAGINISKREFALKNTSNNPNLSLNLNLEIDEGGTGQKDVNPEKGGGGQNRYPPEDPPKDCGQSDV